MVKKISEFSFGIAKFINNPQTGNVDFKIFHEFYKKVDKRFDSITVLLFGKRSYEFIGNYNERD